MRGKRGVRWREWWVGVRFEREERDE